MYDNHCLNGSKQIKHNYHKGSLMSDKIIADAGIGSNIHPAPANSRSISHPSLGISLQIDTIKS